MLDIDWQALLSGSGSFLIGDRFITVWVFGILAYATICLAALVRSALAMGLALRRARREVEYSSSEAEFSRNFSDHDEGLRAIAQIRHAWSEFRESLVVPQSDEPERAVRNTVEPSAFLNDATLIEAAVHTRFFNSVPNHLTAAGILGTFIGLAVGIGTATQAGLADPNSDAKAVLGALKKLLDGASVAFITSIAGIASSLLFLIIERWILSQLHRTLSLWVTALEARLELIRPEMIALDQLKESQIQSVQLRRFNDELVMSLEQALEEKIANRLVTQLEQIERAVEGLRSDQGHESNRAIEKLIAEFTTSLTQRTGSDFDSLSRTLSGIDETLRSSNSAMAATQTEVRTAITEMVSGVRESMQSETASLHELMAAQVTEASTAASRAVGEVSAGIASSGSEAAAQIAQSLAGFGQCAERLEAATRSSADMMPKFESLLERVDALSGTLGNAHQEFDRSVESIRSAATTLSQSTEKSTAAVASTESLTDRILESSKAIQEQQEKTSGYWQDYQARFENIDQSLSNAFSQMDEGLGRYLEQIRTFAQVLDEQTAQAIRNLAAATKELNENLEELIEERGEPK